MSALFSRLVEQHRIGHARTDIEVVADHREPLPETFRDAAVLVPITERAAPGILLIHRPSNMRAHPGQVAFPGGKLDVGETPVEAALREANEELGIPPEAVRVIGEGDLFRTGTGYAITPVIGVIPPDLEIRPNPAEVAQWFEAPLDYVFNPANQHRRSMDLDGRTLSFWEILWEDHRIWGVTGSLMVNLSRRLGWHD